MQPEKDIYSIIASHLSGNSTPEMERELSSWLSAEESNKVLFDELSVIWNNSASQEIPEPNSDVIWKNVSHTLFETAHVKKLKPKSKVNLWWGLPIAAAIFAAVFVAQSLLKTSDNWIEHSSQEVALEVKLPDKSTIWLKPFSTIGYEESFEKRHVQLQGKAFFDVESNPDAPFTVETEHLQTRVLGTEFTVLASKEDTVHQVILIEGSVAVRSESDSVRLIPGEQLNYTLSNKQLTKDSVSIDNTLSWLSRSLTFDSTPLRQVFKDLQIHYGFTLDMPEAEYLSCTFTGTFSNNPVLEDILETLVFTLNLEYQWDKKTLIIIDARCKQVQ